MIRQASRIIAPFLLGGTFLSTAVVAQDASAEGEQVKAVYERYREDYDAPGIRSGSFLFYPTIGLEGKYDSNIYAKESNVTDDFLAILKPGFNLRTDKEGSNFSLFANADVGRFVDATKEDYEDYSFGANAMKEISNGTQVTASVSYDDKHEDRGSPDSPNSAAEYTKYSVLTGTVGFQRDVSILSFAVNGKYENRNFDDAAKFDANGNLTGDVINNDDRDRERYEGTVRVGYELADQYEAFIRGTIHRVKYDNSKEDGGPQRNGDGYEIVGGAAFDITGKSKGEVYAGYLKKSYDSDTLKGFDGLAFGASLLWNPTGLTSFKGSVSRSITETTLAALPEAGVPVEVGINAYASGILATMVSARVEHELRRNVLMFAEGGYTKQDFKRTIRSDDLINAAAGVKYLLNPNWNVGVKYDYKYRDTTEKGQDYKRHAFLVNLKAQW